LARENFDGLDLFGQPVPRTRDKAGRPEHVWTVENSNKINLIFATGGVPKDAAAVLGITMPTLRKHYFSELEQWRVARLRLKAAQLQQLHTEGQKGNVAAIKELFKQMDKGALAQLSDRVANRAPSEPKQAPKGKKEQQKEAAGRIAGKFAPPEQPQLVH
jgi:hypothetical protein